MLVNEAKVELGSRNAALRRLEIPPEGFAVVLPDALTFVVHPGEAELGISVALLGCYA
jgi:hypothetical protein